MRGAAWYHGLYQLQSSWFSFDVPSIFEDVDLHGQLRRHFVHTRSSSHKFTKCRPTERSTQKSPRRLPRQALTTRRPKLRNSSRFRLKKIRLEKVTMLKKMDCVPKVRFYGHAIIVKLCHANNGHPRGRGCPSRYARRQHAVDTCLS